MNILILWPIFGLINIAVAYGTQNHEKRQLGHVHHVGRHHHLFRDSEKEEKEVTPKYSQVINTQPIADYDGFNLITNSDEGLIGFANTSENVGYAFVNRKTGSVKFLLDSKTGTLIRYKTLGKISLIKSEELKCDILHAFSHLLKKYELQNETAPGDSSEISAFSEDGLEVLSNVFLHLGHPKEKSSRVYRSFFFISKLTRRLKSWYFGTLKGLLEGNGPFPLKQNLNRFVSISFGLHKMFTRAVGGLKAILEKVKFQLSPIYNGRNGAEVFVYILRQTGAKFDLGKLWPRLLNDIGELMKIFELLGGGETRNGVDETFAMIGHLWEFLSGRESLPSLIKFLLEASSEESWTKGDDGDFTSVVKDIKNITDEQTKRYDNLGVLSPFVTFFSNLTGNTIIKNGVNISDIVEKWRRRDVIGGLKFVTDVLLKVSSPNLYSTLLFDSFTAFLNATSDPQSLKRLIPGLSIENITSNGGSLWENIRKQYDIDGLLSKNKNATEVLNSVPVFSQFSSTFQQSVGSSLNFTGILDGSSISKYLGKLGTAVTGPTKWTYDIFSQSIKDSSKLIKNIFWDSWKPLIPGFGPGPQIINVTETPVQKVTISKDPQSTKEEKDESEEPTEKKGEETVTKKKEDEPSTKKIDEESSTTKKLDDPTTKEEEEETTTKKKDGCGDCGEKKSTKGEDTETTTPKKEEETTTKKGGCDECDEKKSTKSEDTETSTKKNEEERTDDDKKETEKVEVTTPKDCGGCGKKIDEEKVVGTPDGVNLIPIEYKHHQVKHYGHHNRHYHGNNHQNKHHFKGHHQVKNHHHARKHPVHEKKQHLHARQKVGHKREEKKNNRHHQRNLSHQNKKSDTYSLNGY